MIEAPTSLDEALAAWDRWSQATDMRSSTSDAYRSIAKRFVLWLEPQTIALRGVALEDVERFLASLANSTCKAYRPALRHFFGALIAAGLVSANPIPEKHHMGYRRRSEATMANSSPEADGMIEEFPSLTAVEQQATVDAAAFALLKHDVHVFTEGEGGAPADVDRCERVLRLGEQHGITPYSWAEWNSPSIGTDTDSSDDGAIPSSVPNEETLES